MWFHTATFFCLLCFTGVRSAADSDELKNEIADFDKMISEQDHLAVIFTVPCCACTDCVEAEVLLGGMSKELEDNLGVMVLRVRHQKLKKRFGVKTVPKMVFIRNNKTATYDGAFDFDSVYYWLQDNVQPATFELDDASFEHLTQASTGATTGDWLVLFHDGTCTKNRELMHLEDAGVKLKNKVNVASVNTQLSPKTTARFQITQCPDVIFFRHQKMYRFSLPDITANTLRRFSEGFYKNSKAERVPVPPTMFDIVRDKTIDLIDEYWYTLLPMLAVTTGLTTILLICKVMKTSSHGKSE